MVYTGQRQTIVTQRGTFVDLPLILTTAKYPDSIIHVKATSNLRVSTPVDYTIPLILTLIGPIGRTGPQFRWNSKKIIVFLKEGPKKQTLYVHFDDIKLDDADIHAEIHADFMAQAADLYITVALPLIN